MALSERDVRILSLLAEGKRYKEIGRVVGLSDTTVRGEVRLICARLDVGSKMEAVLKWKAIQ